MNARGYCIVDDVMNDLYFHRIKDKDALLLVSKLDMNNNVLQKFPSITEQKQKTIVGVINKISSKKWTLDDNNSIHTFTLD